MTSELLLLGGLNPSTPKLPTLIDVEEGGTSWLGIVSSLSLPTPPESSSDDSRSTASDVPSAFSSALTTEMECFRADFFVCVLVLGATKAPNSSVLAFPFPLPDCWCCEYSPNPGGCENCTQGLDGGLGVANPNICAGAGETSKYPATASLPATSFTSLSFIDTGVVTPVPVPLLCLSSLGVCTAGNVGEVPGGVGAVRGVQNSKSSPSSLNSSSGGDIDSSGVGAEVM